MTDLEFDGRRGSDFPTLQFKLLQSNSQLYINIINGIVFSIEIIEIGFQLLSNDRRREGIIRLQKNMRMDCMWKWIWYSHFIRYAYKTCWYISLLPMKTAT